MHLMLIIKFRPIVLWAHCDLLQSVFQQDVEWCNAAWDISPPPTHPLTHTHTYTPTNRMNLTTTSQTIFFSTIQTIEQGATKKYWIFLRDMLKYIPAVSLIMWVNWSTQWHPSNAIATISCWSLQTKSFSSKTPEFIEISSLCHITLGDTAITPSIRLKTIQYFFTKPGEQTSIWEWCILVSGKFYAFVFLILGYFVNFSGA